MNGYHVPHLAALPWRDRLALMISTFVGVIITIVLSPVFLVLFCARWIARLRG